MTAQRDASSLLSALLPFVVFAALCLLNCVLLLRANDYAFFPRKRAVLHWCLTLCAAYSALQMLLCWTLTSTVNHSYSSTRDARRIQLLIRLCFDCDNWLFSAVCFLTAYRIWATYVDTIVAVRSLTRKWKSIIEGTFDCKEYANARRNRATVLKEKIESQQSDECMAKVRLAIYQMSEILTAKWRRTLLVCVLLLVSSASTLLIDVLVFSETSIKKLDSYGHYKVKITAAMLNAGDGVHLGASVAMCTVLAVASAKYPSLKDNLFLGKEMRICAQLSAILTVAGVCLTVGRLLVYYSTTTESTSLFVWCAFARSQMASMLLLALAYTQTLFVDYMLNGHRNDAVIALSSHCCHRLRDLSEAVHCCAMAQMVDGMAAARTHVVIQNSGVPTLFQHSSDTPSLSPSPQLCASEMTPRLHRGRSARGTRSITDGGVPISQLMRDTLSDADGFCLFMEHLFRELSFENMLAVIELAQFRQYCRHLIHDGFDSVQQKEEKHSRKGSLTLSRLRGLNLNLAAASNPLLATLGAIMVPTLSSEIIETKQSDTFPGLNDDDSSDDLESSSGFDECHDKDTTPVPMPGPTKAALSCRLSSEVPPTADVFSAPPKHLRAKTAGHLLQATASEGNIKKKSTLLDVMQAAAARRRSEGSDPMPALRAAKNLLVPVSSDYFGTESAEMTPEAKSIEIEDETLDTNTTECVRRKADWLCALGNGVKSAIVFDHCEYGSLCSKFEALFQKYIDDSGECPFMVNVSFRCREALAYFRAALNFGETPIGDFKGVFDTVITELTKIMRDAFMRFTHTDAFLIYAAQKDDDLEDNDFQA